MDSDSDTKYGRILLKLSGEILAGSQSFGIDPRAFEYVCKEIKELNQLNVQIAIVIGGGNIFRGLNASQNGMDRVNADNMGMLATVINSIALKDRLEEMGVPARVMSGVRIDTFVENYVRDKAVRHLKKGRVVILCAGTGRPFFSTDTAASLRAAELKADLIVKATKVDGVYSDDPMKNKDAKRFEKLTFMEVLEKNLKVMDLTSITMCRENSIPICVFDMHTPGNLKKVVAGESVGTIIS